MEGLSSLRGSWEPLRNHEHWDWTITKWGLGQDSNSQGNLKVTLGDIAYFGKLSKLGDKKGSFEA